MEKGHSQLKIFPKRIKFFEIMENGEEDRISALPDCLLLEILSRLPSTKFAIRTGALSKRWNHLWTFVPTLIFKYPDHNLPWSDFILTVDKTLTQCRQLKLKKFEVHTSYLIRFESQVNKWIRYAVSHDVEEFNLTLWSGVLVDQAFFSNTYFTHLTVTGYILNPIGAISWKYLRSLSISYGNIREYLIENILSGCPLLETLVLKYCVGYRRLDITSKSVKNLVLHYCYQTWPLDKVELKAPNILSLTVKGCMFPWVGPLLVDVSSLIEANLDYTSMPIFETPCKEAEEEMLKGFVLNLRHVKDLKIGSLCSNVLSDLKAKGFVIPSNAKLSDGR